jgi:hypothetical protein
VEILDKDEVKFIRKVNQSVEADAAWGLVGGSLLGVGTALTVDSFGVGATDASGRVFNPVGPDVALGLGVGAIALGAGLLTIPIVDAVRGAEGREEHRPYEERGKSLAKLEACGKRRAPKGAVQVPTDSGVDLSFDGDPQPWAWRDVTPASVGKFEVNLETVVPAAVLKRNVRPASLRLGLGGEVIATIDPAPVFATLDNRAWEALAAARDRCQKPDSLDDCDDIRAYATSHPASVRATDARALLAAAQPTFTALRDDAAYSAANADGCKKAETESACGGVEKYLKAWPTGRHAKDAEAALRTGKPKVDRLVAKREAAEKAEAARQLAAERAAEAARKAAEARERAEYTPYVCGDDMNQYWTGCTKVYLDCLSAGGGDTCIQKSRVCNAVCDTRR